MPSSPSVAARCSANASRSGSRTARTALGSAPPTWAAKAWTVNPSGMAPCDEEAWGRGVTGMAHLPSLWYDRLGSLLIVRPTSHSVHSKDPLTSNELHDPSLGRHSCAHSVRWERSRSQRRRSCADLEAAER